jgi:hypothetical protein
MAGRLVFTCQGANDINLALAIVQQKKARRANSAGFLTLTTQTP